MYSSCSTRDEGPEMTVYEAELAVIFAVRRLRGLPLPALPTEDIRWRARLEAAYVALDVLDAVVEKEEQT